MSIFLIALIMIATSLYSVPVSAGGVDEKNIIVDRSQSLSRSTLATRKFKIPEMLVPSFRVLQARGQKWFIAGIAATLSGAMIGSMALAVGLVDACAPWAGNSCIKDARSRAAWAMGMPSVVLFGSGVGMIGYGRFLKHKARLSMQAQASSTNFVVSISGRF